VCRMTRPAAHDWFRAFFAAVALLTVVLTCGLFIGRGQTTWSFVVLLMVWGAPWAVVHSVFARHLEWAGQPDLVPGAILNIAFYTVAAWCVIRISRWIRQRAVTDPSRPFQ
jgi:hypothetical protein